MTTRKNYYVCLRFAHRPKLHLTLRYLENLSSSGMTEAVDSVSETLASVKAQPFHLQLRLEAWYGPRHTVRALEPYDSYVWPNWMLGLIARLPAGSQKYKWQPHVACKDNSLDLMVIAISLMCEKTEVARWDL